MQVINFVECPEWMKQNSHREIENGYYNKHKHQLRSALFAFITIK